MYHACDLGAKTIATPWRPQRLALAPISSFLGSAVRGAWWAVSVPLLARAGRRL